MFDLLTKKKKKNVVTRDLQDPNLVFPKSNGLIFTNSVYGT